MPRRGGIPWNKGKKLSEEHKRKISRTLKGRISPMKGRKHTEETKEKMRGPRPSTWGREGPMHGKHHSEEAKRKISEGNRGKPGLKGKDNPSWGKPGMFTGKKHTMETRRKLSGDKNHNWRGGASFLPYGPEFTRVLKRQIKERDGHKCKYQGCEASDKLCIHHINYRKDDCRHTNLVTLCRSHNVKVNNNRDYWEKYFSSYLKIRGGEVIGK